MSVSVCVNICDRPKFLYKLLTSLSFQTDMNYELVLVDDGVESCADDVNVKRSLDYFRTITDVNYIKNKRKLGLAVSRNVASDASSGDIIVKLDDDHFCDSDFVRQLVSSYEDEGVGCVGAVFPLIKDGILVTDKDFELLGDFDNDKGWENRQLVCYPPWHKTLIPAITVRGIMSYRKDAKIRHREDLTYISHREDTIFSMEYINNGYKNFINTRAIAYHLYAGVGGCRSFSSTDATNQRKKDDELFHEYLRENWKKQNE